MSTSFRPQVTKETGANHLIEAKMQRAQGTESAVSGANRLDKQGFFVQRKRKPCSSGELASQKQTRREGQAYAH